MKKNNTVLEPKSDDKVEKSIDNNVPLIPVPLFILKNIGNALLKGILWILDLLLSMVLSIGHFFKVVGLVFYKGAIKVYRFFRQKVIQFKENDLSGRLSFVFFGASSFAHGQIVNGIFYILFEIGYILFMIFGGGYNLFMLQSLGLVESGIAPDADPDDMFNEYIIGDNSVLILIFGLLTLISIVLFLYVWNRSINSGYNNYRIMNYVKYKKTISNNIEFSNEIEQLVENDFTDGYRITNGDKDKLVKANSFNFKQRHNDLLINRLNEIEDKFDKSVCRRTFNETIRLAFEYNHELAKLNAKLEKANEKRTRYVTSRASKLALLEEQFANASEEEKVKLERKKMIFENNTNSNVYKHQLKIDQLQNKIRELTKRHSSYANIEYNKNETKYGRYNVYYKNQSSYNSQLEFFRNYDKVVKIYDNSKGQYEEQNGKNIAARNELHIEGETKIQNINKKYDEIVNHKQKLTHELNVVNEAQQNEINAYKKSLKLVVLERQLETVNKDDTKQIEDLTAKVNKLREQVSSLAELIIPTNEEDKAIIAELPLFKVGQYSENEATGILEIKSKYFKLVSHYAGELHNLPSDKAIKGMREEEIKEVNHAVNRDTKALKTNFTDDSFARETVINYLVVEFKFDYNLANDLFKFVNIKDKGSKELRHLTTEEVETQINELSSKVEDLVNNNPDKFIGKPVKFKEQWASLMNENFHISILALPVTGIVLFVIMPLLFSIVVAFTNYSEGHVPPTQLFTWIGFDNFKTIFFADSGTIYAALPKAMANTISWTIVWTILATFSNYFLGIILALIINKKGIKLKKLWRTIFIMTIAIPQFITLLSIGILLKDNGAIGEWFRVAFGHKLGFGTDTTNGALVSKIIIILVNIWVGVPYTMLSTTGILMNIPTDLYESAKVDGASTFTQFTKITLPYILFVTGPHLITQFIGNVNNFNVIYFLTGGGPSISGSPLPVGNTDLLITFIYKIVTSNNNPQFGIASAIGIVVFVICAFFSIIMFNKSDAIKQEDQFQ